MTWTVDRTASQHYADDTGRRYWSVSQVRNRMDPGAFDRVGKDVLAKASLRGQLVHGYAALYLMYLDGLVQVPEVPEGYEGYCQAVRLACDQLEPEVLDLEEIDGNLKMGIAGTKDFLAGVTWKGKRNRVALCDWKTGAPTKTDPAQLMLYHTFPSNEHAEVLLDIYLRRDGTYTIVEVKKKDHAHDWAAALNAIQALKIDQQLTEWRKRK